MDLKYQALELEWLGTTLVVSLAMTSSKEGEETLLRLNIKTRNPTCLQFPMECGLW